MTQDASGIASPIRILFIDDAEDDVLLLTFELQKGGLDFVHQHIETLEQLKQALQTQPWDVVIADHCMVGFSSADVLSQVRALNPDLPVIIVSGAIAEQVAVDALHDGARDFVMKDNLARLLPAILREHAQKQSRLQLQQQTDEMQRLRQQERARAKQKMRELLAAARELSQCDSSVAAARIAFSHLLNMYPYLATASVVLSLPQKNGSQMVDHIIWQKGAFTIDQIPTLASAENSVALAELRDISVRGGHLILPIRSDRKAWGYLDLKDVRPDDGEEPVDNDFANNIIHFLAMILESLDAKENARLATVGAMAAGIVHDLKNPIAAIQGCAELALDGATSVEERSDLLQAIVSETGRMSLMAQEILEFTRNELVLAPTKISARQFMRDVGKSLQQMCISVGVRCEIECDLEGTIEIDVDRVRRVLLNIGRNACDALQKQGNAQPVFQLVLQRVGGEAEWIARDNGPGIPAAIHATLFEPFVTYGKANGTGLGMAIAKRIVDAHGGKIQFSSQPDKGVEFRIAMPLQFSGHLRSRDGQLATNAKLDSVKACNNSNALEHLSVLVAEDNPVNQTVICRMLEQQGCSVSRVANGVEALRQLGSQHFDVALVDCEMAGLSGLEVASLLRQRPEFRKLVIVGLTGHYGASELENARVAGMNGVLHKPFNQAALSTTLQALLRRPGAPLHPPGRC